MRHQAFGEGKRSWIDLVIAHVRLSRVRREITKHGDLLDLGCGYSGDLLASLKDQIKSGTGIDLSVKSQANLIKGRVDQKLPLASSAFETVSALAIIEHVEHPEVMLRECYRVLKKGGKVLITTPSLMGKIPLEVMARLGLISKAEIDDHKRYYTKDTLRLALVEAGFSNVEVRRFGILWLNLFAKAHK